MAADEGHPGDEVVRLVLELAEKSLVVADLDSPGPRFRLLDTTRAYALEKARERGELAALARRHATYFLELLEAASRERAEGDDGYAAVEPDMDNLRAALAWAFAPAGDPTVGVGLAAAALPLWFSTSLLGEALAWTERAIRTLDEAGLLGSREEMALQTALGISLQMVRGRTSEAHAPLNRALALAERHHDADFQLHVLHTLWIHHMRVGEVRTALDLARRAEAIAASMADPVASATAEWMLGIACTSPVNTRRRARVSSICSSPPAQATAPSDPPRRLRSARHCALRPGPRPLGAGTSRPGRGSRPDRRGGGAAPAAPRHLVLRARLGSMRVRPPGA